MTMNCSLINSQMLAFDDDEDYKVLPIILTILLAMCPSLCVRKGSCTELSSSPLE